MSLPAIGIIGAINECVTLFQWAKSAISSLHSRWSGSQEQSLQDGVLLLESGLQRLRDTLPAMYDLIDEAEWRSHEKSVAKLLPNLKDAVYEAEDLLDEFKWYEMKVQVEVIASQSSFIEFFDTVIQGSFNKLNDVQLRLDHLSRQLENMGLCGVTQHFDKSVRPETTSLPNETKIFGRDEELEQVLGFLNVPTNSKRKRATSSTNASTSASASDQVSNESRISSIPVLSIVGIGGVGKTTLAQHISNHQRVKSHFELIIWVCVSDDFDVKRLAKEVIQSCNGKEATSDNLDALQRALSNHVDKRRLLIVLDDMWDDALKENGQCWKRFCAPFRSVQEGSVMLVTTRCPTVDEGVRTMDPVILEGLEDDVFWNFFKLCAFRSESSYRNPELECIGRKILPKLKGSPLAAKTLGRMLSTDLQASHWNSILQSELWELSQEETDILPALRLSFMYLPFHLKQCFSFCAVYPKDYKFEEGSLAEIWRAEGFVHPQGGATILSTSLQYFEDLVTRSFFQRVGSRYVIHDLLHDMAQMVSVHDCFILRNKNDFNKVPKSVRHLYVLPGGDFDDSNLLRLCEFTKLRTLICEKKLGKKSVSAVDQWGNELLRMRVFSCAFINELPDSIGNWKHLRYLEISKACPLKRIPSTICWLYNLRILFARKCKPESLPNDFGKLINLERFRAHGLSYHAGTDMTIDSAKELGQGIRLMKNLNQFHGKLTIENVGNLSKEYAAESELKNKKYLEVLSLRMRSLMEGSPKSEIIQNKEVLEALQPPTSLKSLYLADYDGASLPSWFQPQNLPSLKFLSFGRCVRLESISSPSMLGSVPTESIGDFHSLEELKMSICPNIQPQRLVSPSLKKLHLWDAGLFCSIDCFSLTDFNLECEYVTSIQLEKWSLPSLRSLSIDCSSLAYIGGNTTTFPSLKVLIVTFCYKLLTLDGILTQESLPAIEEIDIQQCPKLLSLPIANFPNLKHLVVDRCPSLNWQRGLVLPSSLQKLGLTQCGDISPYVPSCLENLTSLVSLSIGGQGITSIPGDIWHSNLASLEELVISGCPDLISIGGAKAVRKIKELVITACPNLKKEEQIFRTGQRYLCLHLLLLCCSKFPIYWK
ncbi:disease resistance protein RGA2-like [Triticum dicoccoides]|uniref:disease resistance protein RGA2-like n=1 Tax=Triticum dicoccoides TaxID=85692 RepID=UPI00188E15B1|nr:disease resistance protein RGA2-like [Triticum dicoccoides]